MNKDTIICGTGLKKAYGSNLLFQNLDISLERGHALGIVGRNGCGKSTLLNVLLGVIKPDAGEVSYAFPQNRLAYEVGVQLQDGYFEEMLRLGEITDYFCQLYDLPADRGRELLAYFELTKSIKTPLRKLSGGERQKVNILLAVLHRPNLLFFDEITTGLDAHSRGTIYQYMKTLRQDKYTVVLVSHYFEEIWQLCDRILIFSNDKDIIQTTPKSLGDNFESFNREVSRLVGGIEL